MKFLFTVFSILTVLSTTAFPQEKFTVSGHVYDAENGEVLIGATFQVVGQKIGGMTNAYGFYSVTLPAGSYTFRYSYIGYKPFETSINVDKDIKNDVRLAPAPTVIEEVVVESQKQNDNVTSAEMGTAEIKPQDVSAAPILFGEQDILKTIQLLPGIGQTSEGSSGFFVRGGYPDQNLVLLDEATVYNASHFLGFFSVFNSDAIKNVKMIKGAAPSEYGGRLSSVMDVRMKDGNSSAFHVNGGIGLISSRLNIEGPIKKDRGSFMLSARRTYADIFLKLAKNEDVKKSKLYFYDMNLKANYEFSPNDKIFISGYSGRDLLGNSDDFTFDWGNSTGTVRWNHIFSNKLFSNTSLIVSNFDYVITVKDSGSRTDITSGIKDRGIKQDFQYFVNPNSMMKFGFNVIHHQFTPGKITATEGSNLNTYKIHDKYAYESAAYIGHEFSPAEKLKFDYGLRYSLFSIVGPGDVFSYNENGDVISEKKYDSNELIKSYGAIEPRIIANYTIDKAQSVKLSYAQNRQYIHLLSNTTSGTPLDVWHPSTNIVKPGKSSQVSAGYFRNIHNDVYETSAEIYYKDLKGQVDYKNGADILLNKHVESQLVFGKGWAYGSEFFLKKNSGRLTGWMSYTLSNSRRQFPGINGDRSFPSKYDRTHDISIVGMFKKSEKWTYSATFVFYTGTAVTFPSGKYMIDNMPVNYYTERNGYRMPAYHRLDLGATWVHKKTGRYESSVNFSIYNAYGHKNAYSIYFRENEKNPKITEAVRVSLFTFFPSITYNFSY